MTKDQNQLFTALLGTCRNEFYKHAFPQTDSREPAPPGGLAFLHTSLSRAQRAAELLGFENDPKAPYEILSTTPSIVQGLQSHYAGDGPADLMAQLRKAQAHHLKHRNIERPVVKALGEFIDCRALPNLKTRVHQFGN